MIKKLVALLLCLSISGLSQAATKFMESGTDATQSSVFYNTYTAGTGSFATSTVTANTGPRSLRLQTPAGSDQAIPYTNTGVLTDAGTRVSFWIRLNTFGAFQIVHYTSGFGAIFEWQINDPTGETYVSTGYSYVKTCNTTLVTGQWYHVSIASVVTTTTNFTFKIFVNGVLDCTMTNADVTLAGTGMSILGFSANNFSTAADVYIDDVYVDNSNALTDPGPIRVTAKRPFSNGAVNGFTTQIGSGNSGYGSGHADEVNERPLSTTNGWSMVGAGSAVTEEYNIENAAKGDVDISSGRFLDSAGWLYGSSLAPETAQIILNGATSNISLAGSALFTKFAGSAAYPAGTGADIGLITSTDLTTVSLYEAGVLVAYLPPFPRRQIIISEE